MHQPALEMGQAKRKAKETLRKDVSDLFPNELEKHSCCRMYCFSEVTAPVLKVRELGARYDTAAHDTAILRTALFASAGPLLP